MLALERVRHDKRIRYLLVANEMSTYESSSKAIEKFSNSTYTYLIFLKKGTKPSRTSSKPLLFPTAAKIPFKIFLNCGEISSMLSAFEPLSMK